jgi:nitroimidazol reductase NimA-like FMN-containing flavoprotein (pyridoxamine 5'-phosphate oxidase superfamily)
MRKEEDPGAIVHTIIDSNFYMVLGTADEDGRPWVSPVYFVADNYKDFYWVSSPDVTHSRNLAMRPEMSIVIFDSQVRPGTGQAVYMSAVAEELVGADVEPVSISIRAEHWQGVRAPGS